MGANFIPLQLGPLSKTKLGRFTEKEYSKICGCGWPHYNGGEAP
jgi:hypothetical protein